MISNRQQHLPITELIGRLNLHLPGWKNYYGKRHCGMAMQRINWQVENRLRKHLRREASDPGESPKEAHCGRIFGNSDWHGSEKLYNEDQ